MIIPNNQRILVNGGTGFAGANLVRRLLERGHDVFVLDNKKGSVYDELISKGARIKIGSITDKKLVESLVEGYDTIQHIAAAFRAINVAKSLTGCQCKQDS